MSSLTADRSSYTVLESNSFSDLQIEGKSAVLPSAQGEKESYRNLLAFWILGLCNNFSYVVMLSAAFDILSPSTSSKDDKNETHFHCNPHSTGVVLLADILPSFLIQLTAPYYMQSVSYHVRVAFVVLCNIASFLLVALAPHVWVAVLGVVAASISCGFGEITFLSLSSHFKKSAITSWASGTGAAGVCGALAYAGLTSAGVSPRNSILSMLGIPLLLGVSFWILLKLPPGIDVPRDPLLQAHGQDLTRLMPLSQKLHLMVPLMTYMVPLFLVYLAEYTINQGLFELLFYNMSWLSQPAQYRWFQVDYQIGVLVSRSSASLFRIRPIFIPALVQYGIFLVILMEVMYTYMPFIWITLLIVFLEGLCGGAVYVNAFHNISEDVPAEFREFSMGAAGVAGSLGIAIAGLISVPIHTALCRFKTSYRMD